MRFIINLCLEPTLDRWDRIVAGLDFSLQDEALQFMMKYCGRSSLIRSSFPVYVRYNEDWGELFPILWWFGWGLWLVKICNLVFSIHSFSRCALLLLCNGDTLRVLFAIKFVILYEHYFYSVVDCTIPQNAIKFHVKLLSAMLVMLTDTSKCHL